MQVPRATTLSVVSYGRAEALGKSLRPGIRSRGTAAGFADNRQVECDMSEAPQHLGQRRPHRQRAVLQKFTPRPPVVIGQVQRPAAIIRGQADPVAQVLEQAELGAGNRIGRLQS